MSSKLQPLIPFILVLCHFTFDWLYQTHAEAIAKAKDRNVRFFHCLMYSVPFMPVLWALGMNTDAIFVSLVILFGTHFVIDSYVPVMLWAKYLRRAPQFDDVCIDEFRHVHSRVWQDRVVEKKTYANDEEAFKAMAGTPIGLILIIVMDQFFHIVCLLPIAFMAMR